MFQNREISLEMLENQHCIKKSFLFYILYFNDQNIDGKLKSLNTRAVFGDKKPKIERYGENALPPLFLLIEHGVINK